MNDTTRTPDESDGPVVVDGQASVPSSPHGTQPPGGDGASPRPPGPQPSSAGAGSVNGEPGDATVGDPVVPEGRPSGPVRRASAGGNGAAGADVNTPPSGSAPGARSSAPTPPEGQAVQIGRAHV